MSSPFFQFNNIPQYQKTTVPHVHKPIKKSKAVILTVVFLAVFEYLFLVPLNLQGSFTWFLIFVISVFLIMRFSAKAVTAGKKNPSRYVIAAIAVLIVISIFVSPLGSSSRYASRITVTSESFEENVEPVNLSNIPLVDKDSSEKLGDRTMGNLPEYVSQYTVSDAYTQIVYQGKLVRVTPLEYAGFFKWMNNRASGTPGYIIVDSTTGEASLTKLDQGMKYVPSAYLQEDLSRTIFLQYPTKIVGTSIFEIDESGHPYWITPSYKMRWIAMMPDIEGSIITDACTGKSTYYPVSDVPEWVDHVYPSDLIIDQVQSWGKYQGGFVNSLIGQSGVTSTTDGYNYIPCNSGNDVCLYTGITSIQEDQSNIGFVLSNLRTKETNYYAAAGAEEYSAQGTAQGAIQEKNYTATFPILINLDGRPTYLLSLKDASGLVKAYALVDVQDYQKVAVADVNDGIASAVNQYRKLLGISTEIVTDTKTTRKTVTVQEVQTAVVDGNTLYYILTADGSVYQASIQMSDLLPFLKTGDTLVLVLDESGTVVSIG